MNLKKIRSRIQKVYLLGGINTVSWLCYNPIRPNETAKSKVDSTISNILNTPILLNRYNLWIDKVEDYLISLKAKNGRNIPIILRLFHENNGTWFWWGKNQCTPEEYKQFWRYTVDYLRITKHVHNVLYVYNTDRFSSAREFLERYPGDGYVDILGADVYDHESNHHKFIPLLKSITKILKEIGCQRNKPYAIMETGFKFMPVKNWWTQTLLPVLKFSGLAYVLVWRNSSYNSFWGVYKDHPSALDFKEFSNSNGILFLPNISKTYK